MIIKYPLGQLELREYLRNPEGNKRMKDVYPPGPTAVHEVSMPCEDGACETAGKGLVQGRKRGEMNLT